MKTCKLVLFFLMLSSTSIFAQYGNNYGGRGGYRSNGIPTASDSKPSPESIEKNKTERIENAVARMKEELTLDELQVIAIRNEIVSNTKSIDILMKSEISQEDKNKEYISIQEKADKTIMSYLNPAQKEKYLQTKLEKNSKKEDKKRKKKEVKEDNEKVEN